MDLSPKLRQTVKTQNSSKGEILSHGIVWQAVHEAFKLKAVQRLEQGVSIAEVARALAVSANVLHRWRREFREGPGNAFSGKGRSRPILTAATAASNATVNVFIPKAG
jgi:transposase-like protein